MMNLHLLKFGSRLLRRSNKICRYVIVCRRCQALVSSSLCHLTSQQRVSLFLTFSPRIRQFHLSPQLKGVVSFLLADIGEGIKEAQIIEWYIKVGDSISQFQPICAVKSDKATTDITSRYDGIVTKIYYGADDYAQVGQPLIDVQLNEESTTQQEDIPDQFAEIEKVDDDEKSTSPAVRKLAAEMKIPLDKVKGSGKSGKILKADILNYSRPDRVESDTSSSSSSSSSSDDESSRSVLAAPATRALARDMNVNLKAIKGSGPDGRITKQDVQSYVQNVGHPSAVAGPEAARDVSRTERPVGEDRTEPIRGVRKAMLKSMTIAQQIPHFSYCDEIDVSKLITVRRELSDAVTKDGQKLSFMPFFIKAVSMALNQFPILNSSVDEKLENIIYKAAHNVSVAMDTPSGLVVPNIKNVQSLNLQEINQELRRLHNLALTSRLTVADLSDGTISISNIGSIGGTYTKPIILYPQVAIVALGSMRDVPRFDDDGAITKVSIIYATWCADHRVIDGATMARYCNVWKSYIEEPSSMILSLR